MHCLNCSDHPHLVQLSSDLKIDAVNPDKVACRGCGYKFGADYHTKQVRGCIKCRSFFLCSNCKLCINGHYLFKCFDLKNKKAAGLYRSNKYNCDYCSVTKTIRSLPTDHEELGIAKLQDNHFVWHCNTCDFDICPKHFQQSPFRLHLSIKQSEAVSVVAPECSVLTGTEHDVFLMESPKQTKTSSKFIGLSGPPSLKVKLMNTLKSFHVADLANSQILPAGGFNSQGGLKSGGGGASLSKTGSLLF
jgi:hypothetical protein